MSSTGILPLTGIAATNSNSSIRVYFQANSGALRESEADGGIWSPQANNLPVPVEPTTFTPIAATSYDNFNHIRVYYLDTNYKLSELCYDLGKGWYAGELNNNNFPVACYSQLAVVHWDDQLRVYYQADDNRIYEAARSGTNPWSTGGLPQEAMPGSRLAAIRTQDGEVRVYYQAPDSANNVIKQVTSNNNWGDVETINVANSPPHGAIAATFFGGANGIDSLRLYYQQPNAELFEIEGTTGSSGWTQGPLALANYIPQTHLASLSWGDMAAIRVYGQTKDNAIQEVKFDASSGWTVGAVVPN